MGRSYEICGAKPKVGGNQWSKCNRKAGHTGQHSDTKMSPAMFWRDDAPEVNGFFPCPHGCENHTVKTDPATDPTGCGHYHSPTEWGHHEQEHNSAYWASMSASQSGPERIKPRDRAV